MSRGGYFHRKRARSNFTSLFFCHQMGVDFRLGGGYAPPMYQRRNPNADDPALGPFRQSELARLSLGVVNEPPPAVMNPEINRALGVTANDFQALLDMHPDAKDFIDAGEAQTLQQYLQANTRYDPSILANLLAELTTGLKARRVGSGNAPAIHPPLTGIGGPTPDPWLGPEGPEAPSSPLGSSDYWFLNSKD